MAAISNNIDHCMKVCWEHFHEETGLALLGVCIT